MSDHESPEERAQRSVERMFPHVARFLASDTSGLPVYGPTDPFGDEEHTPDVIVRVDYLMSREQLTTALGMAWAEIAANRDPESLTSIEVRHEVEAWLSVQGLHELGLQMERDAQRVFPPEQQRVMQVLAEAIARAYPPRREPEQSAVQRPEREGRTVTVQTLDRGAVTTPEPFWCVGQHPAGEFQADLAHEGEAELLLVDTRHGPVKVASACLYQRPFAEHTTRTVTVAVEFDASHEFDSASLADLADSLVAWSVGPLHDLITRLQLLEGES